MWNIFVKIIEIVLITAGIAIASTFVGIFCAFVCRLFLKNRLDSNSEDIMLKSCMITSGIILTLIIILQKK